MSRHSAPANRGRVSSHVLLRRYGAWAAWILVGLVVSLVPLRLHGQTSPAAQPVLAVDSVGITLREMDRSVDFYTKVLSFEKVSDVEVAVFTGEVTLLDDAWVNYGLTMSFLVFPWGLDSMLLRVFPAIIFPIARYHSSKPTRYITGIGAFFAGLGIMCAERARRGPIL